MRAGSAALPSFGSTDHRERLSDPGEDALAAEDLGDLEDPGLAVPPVTATRTGCASLPSARLKRAITASNACSIAAVVHVGERGQPVAQARAASAAVGLARCFAAAAGSIVDVVGEVVRAGVDQLDERLGALLQRRHHAREPGVVARDRVQPRASMNGFTRRDQLLPAGGVFRYCAVHPLELLGVEDAGRLRRRARGENARPAPRAVKISWSPCDQPRRAR